MMGIKGTTVTLCEKVDTGEHDPFGHALYTYRKSKINNVLIAPQESTDENTRTDLDVVRTVYVLAIPKGDRHTWTGNTVKFFGVTWKVVGEPMQGLDENVPLCWNKKVKVVRYE